MMADNPRRIRLVSEEILPANHDVWADYIYCLDLKFINPQTALVWIGLAYEIYQEYSPTSTPMVVAMGSSFQLRLHGQLLVKVGAILWEKPDEFDTWEDEQKVNFIEREFSYPEEEWNRRFHRLEGGDYDGDWLSYEDAREGREEMESERPSAGLLPHLRIYVDPPYHLSSDDFQRLVERMRMADDDPRKDD